MPNIYNVIGANYGDEGKGLVTAALHQMCGVERTLIVLSNGGAQRGHTVEWTGGRRVVMSHHGSAIEPVDTYCPSTFVINPIVFRTETVELRNQYIPSKDAGQVFIHQDCIVTTPWDMMANQYEETMAGDDRWGSTGMGVWHTMNRCATVPGSRLTYGELRGIIRSRIEVEDRLTSIRDAVAAQFRKKCFGVMSTVDMGPYSIAYWSRQLLNNFIEDCEYMLGMSKVAPHGLLGEYQNVIFENGQGLLLDASNGRHSTPSHTGCYNMGQIVKEDGCEVKQVKLFYVSRTYMTKHGAGKFASECSKAMLNYEMHDRTNEPNEWQGSLRYGILDRDELYYRVMQDAHKCGLRPSATSAYIVLTHCNEVPHRDMFRDTECTCLDTRWVENAVPNIRGLHGMPGINV